MIKKIVGLLSCFLLITQIANANERLRVISQQNLIDTAKQSDTLIIDVRTPKEFAAGHIPGAINLPHRDIISGKITLEKYSENTLVLYCHSGVRVGIVNKYLQKNPSLSREKLLHLQGDFRAWRARGKPIIKP